MHSRKFAFALLAATVVFGVNIARAEDAPKDNKGYTTGKTTVVDLGPEIQGKAGCQLRLRVLTIARGGHSGLHSDKERPFVVYFMEGTDTVTRQDGTSQTFLLGDDTGDT